MVHAIADFGLLTARTRIVLAALSFSALPLTLSSVASRLALALLENPQNQALTDELANLPKKEVKEQKPKAEKKAKKGKKAKGQKAVEVTGEREPTEAAVETEVPSAEEAERVELEGKGTLIMPHTHKDKKAKTEKSEEV